MQPIATVIHSWWKLGNHERWNLKLLGCFNEEKNQCDCFQTNVTVSKVTVLDRGRCKDPWWPNQKTKNAVPSGFAQALLVPSFIKKFQKIRQLFLQKHEPRLPPVEATRKKGRPSLRSGLNKSVQITQS